jgi:cobalamin biosynthesis protein CobD/CbiB
MKNRALIGLLIATSLLGYLEWGGDNKTFLFQAELDVFKQLFSDPKSIVHPFVLLPLFGQLLLLIALFQKKPSKILIYIGISCLALLLGFMFFIGIIQMNVRIFGSTLPFLIVVILTIFKK